MIVFELIFVSTYDHQIFKAKVKQKHQLNNSLNAEMIELVS